MKVRAHKTVNGTHVWISLGDVPENEHRGTFDMYLTNEQWEKLQKLDAEWIEGINEQ